MEDKKAVPLRYTTDGKDDSYCWKSQRVDPILSLQYSSIRNGPNGEVPGVDLVLALAASQSARIGELESDRSDGTKNPWKR